jgi:hypothetical protein
MYRAVLCGSGHDDGDYLRDREGRPECGENLLYLAWHSVAMRFCHIFLGLRMGLRKGLPGGVVKAHRLVVVSSHFTMFGVIGFE